MTLQQRIDSLLAETGGEVTIKPLVPNGEPNAAVELALKVLLDNGVIFELEFIDPENPNSLS
jgi:hypothetical protein